MKYVRPDGEAYIRTIQKETKNFNEAADFEGAHQAFVAILNANSHFNTTRVMASIRNSQDTNDEFYRKEMEYIFEIEPQIEKEFGEVYSRQAENKVRLTDPCNADLQIQENKLVQKYFQVAAAPVTDFHGEQLGFYGLLKMMEDTDRSIRKEAFEKWAELYKAISDELDSLYTELIGIRQQMAKNLGFSGYAEMMYQKMERFEYTPEDVAIFRKQIREHIVPLCQKLYEEQKERLGIEELKYYDESLTYPDGNAVPEGTEEELLEKARTMYHELSKETGEFFDFMMEYCLFDLEGRQGKQQGGYCDFMEEYKAPFIFANFNGTNADVNVLTHEAGHAFEAYTASRNIPVLSQTYSTAEINEIHSMAMEYFTLPWMHLFFGENAEKQKKAYLWDSLEAMPYMACVDEFQHRVYAENLTDAMERRKVWHELEKIYLPWRDYDGNEFLGQGGFWMQKQHLFMCPFYYIDYALAQICAFQFFERSKKEPEKAWGDYYRLCQAGGSKGYFALLELAGLKNPFVDGTVEEVVAGLKPYLKRKVKYTIRPVKEEDLKKVAEVEALCFPAAEAAGYEDFMERYKTCKNSFFVAETEDGEIAGFCNGCCADTDYLADALYHDATLHNPDGDYQMIFGLDVNPKFQKQGIGEALMRHMVKSAGERDKKAVVLTCKDHMIPFYKRIGYEYIELSDSTHGGAKWHKMMYRF